MINFIIDKNQLSISGHNLKIEEKRTGVKLSHPPGGIKEKCDFGKYNQQWFY